MAPQGTTDAGLFQMSASQQMQENYISASNQALDAWLLFLQV